MKLRSRIFLSMTTLSAGIVLLSFVFSAFLAEPFYLRKKRLQLEEIATKIGDLPSDISGKYTDFAKLERSTSVHITVTDSQGRLVYDTNISNPREQERLPPQEPSNKRPPPFVPEEPGMRPPPPRDLPIPSASRNIAVEPGTTMIVETTDPRMGIRLLYLIERKENGLRLALSFPLAEVEESARTASFFLLLSSLVGLLIGSVLALLISRRVTQPFNSLMTFSRSLAQLDFSMRFTGGGDKEVDALGHTMNELAESLAAALAELEERNARLREDVERERRIDAMRREFVASVSHELKTPISLIQGYAEGLLEEVPQGPKERRAYLEVIIDETQKMDAQVRDLLELSQLESGAAPLNLSTFDPSELLREVIALFERSLKERGAVVRAKLEASQLTADRDKIERVAVNFLTNAIEHLDEGGLLEVEIGPEREGIQLSVFNEGPQIPEEALELVWNSYFKVDPARTRRFGGTGLGLAIVRGIVTRHGGRTWVENVEATTKGPRGVRFSVWLPQAEANEAPPLEGDVNSPKGRDTTSTPFRAGKN